MDEEPNVPLVSVIMPAYRMGRFIGIALEAVGAQTFSNWEVVVVDDHGPDDGTEGIVRAFAAKHRNNRVEFIRHPENRGVSAARNTAIAAAKGDLLAFLDPDDLWLPSHLEELTRVLRDNDHVSVVSSPMEFLWERDGERSTWLYDFKEWMIKGWPHSLAMVNFILPSSVLARKQAVLDVGGFDTDPDIQHLEDYDLWVRLAKARHRFWFHREQTACYRKHNDAASADRDRMFKLHVRLYERHPKFFREGRDGMVDFLGRELFTLEEHWQELRHRVRFKFGGPIMRTLLYIDGVLGHWLRRLASARPGPAPARNGTRSGDATTGTGAVRDEGPKVGPAAHVANAARP